MKRAEMIRGKSIRSLLFTLLFVIATVSTALHELSPHHHSDSCPVCVVDEHSLSADIVGDVTEERTLLVSEQYTSNTTYIQVKPSTILNARAPPILFS